MQLIIDTNGAVLRRKNESFLIYTKAQSRMISPHRVDSIALSANCMISTAALRLAILHQIPVYLHDGYGNPEGAVLPISPPSIATLRRKQALFYYLPQATDFVVDIFEAKLQAQLLVLHHIIQDKNDLAKKETLLYGFAEQWQQYRPQRIEEARASLMGIEGNIARHYWQWLSEALPPSFRFERRSRQPAEDIFNCLLNYGYGMLYTIVEAGIVAAGLDPQMGLLHTDEYKQPTLAFDLIEPFRPYVDSLVMDLCLEQKARITWFDVSKEKSVLLATVGKKEFIPLFYDMLHTPIIINAEHTSLKQHCYKLAIRLADLLRHSKIQIF